MGEFLQYAFPIYDITVNVYGNMQIPFSLYLHLDQF